jgi:hypothetical protein
VVFHICLDGNLLKAIASSNLDLGDGAPRSITEHLAKMARLVALAFSTKLLLGCLLGRWLHVAGSVRCPTAKEFVAEFRCSFFQLGICLVALLVFLLCFFQSHAKWVRYTTLPGRAPEEVAAHFPTLLALDNPLP